VAPGWYAVGRYNYSLLDGRLVEGLAGIEYNAGCWSFRTVWQRVAAATNVSSAALYVQLELRGIGQIGTDETVELLKRSVPGYSLTTPSDPMLTPPSARPRLPFEQVY
jgi:LPS-assembly protein